LQTPIVYTDIILPWKVLEFINGKLKGTNPAIMGNPINMYAVNGRKKTINLITKETKYKLSEPCRIQQTKSKLHEAQVKNL